MLSYQRVIYLCLLILTNAPGISPGCTSVALYVTGARVRKVPPVSSVAPRVYNELYTFMRMVKLELKKSNSKL